MFRFNELLALDVCGIILFSFNNVMKTHELINLKIIMFIFRFYNSTNSSQKIKQGFA